MVRSKSSRLLPIAAALTLIALVGGLGWYIHGELSKKESKKRQTVQIIKIIRPPPDLPPPPPPPPPPPDKVDQQLPKDTPDEKPDEAPPQQPLGIDADASAGSDAFGLAARKGGNELVGSGSSIFAWYTGILKTSVIDALSDDERIRRGNYSIIVRVWLAADGRVERVTVAEPTGNKEIDGLIQQALGRMTHIREAPPLEMPQPVTLKIVLRS